LPTKSSLVCVEYDKLEMRCVIVNGNAPFLIVVRAHVFGF
jgi:hypothetical protein